MRCPGRRFGGGACSQLLMSLALTGACKSVSPAVLHPGHSTCPTLVVALKQARGGYNGLPHYSKQCLLSQAAALKLKMLTCLREKIGKLLLSNRLLNKNIVSFVAALLTFMFVMNC